jgi:hypothetical protein
MAPVAPHLGVVLKLSKELAQDVDQELVLGGDPFFNAPIDLSQRGRRNVELALARLWLFALGLRRRKPGTHDLGHHVDREAVREHDRLGRESAAAGGGRVALARVAAWVAYRGHWTCLRDDDERVERRSHCHRTGRYSGVNQYGVDGGASRHFKGRHRRARRVAVRATAGGTRPPKRAL